jgi:hypothetical protein
VRRVVYGSHGDFRESPDLRNLCIFVTPVTVAFEQFFPSSNICVP